VTADGVHLGSIGLGWWGGVLASATQKLNGVRVTGCFARNRERRQEFASKHGCEPAGFLDALLSSDIDGVLIATPHTTHADLVVAAARAGKHVFVDKPLTLTTDEADRAIEAARKAGVVLQVGHNRRRQPANRRIKELIESDSLGQVLELGAVHDAPLLFNPALAEWRRRLDETPAGGMSALGVHQIDTFHYLAGPIARVVALSKRSLPQGEVDDVTSILLEFVSGAVGTLSTSQATGPAVDVAVFGTDAIARNTGDGARLTIQRRGTTDQEDLEIAQIDTVADELDEFARSIDGQATPETGGVEARAAVAVLEAIVASAAERRWVDVDHG
jgi:predicted dehydrogenase